MADKQKKRVRAVQDLTGWKYQFCLFLVRQLGQDAVLEALADGDCAGPMRRSPEVARALNERAKAAQREGTTHTKKGLAAEPHPPDVPENESP